MELTTYLAMAVAAEESLADALVMVSDKHDRDPEIRDQCRLLASWSRGHIEAIKPFIEQYGEDKSKNEQVQQLRGALFHGTRVGGTGLLADLQDLATLTNSALSKWTCINQAAKALHDKRLDTTSERACEETDRQLSWIKTEIKVAASQALVVDAEKGSEVAASLPRRETPSTQQNIVWAPTAAGLLMLVVGGVALVGGMIAGLPGGYPWLFPSLGPSAYLQAEAPGNPASRFYNTVVGHLIGLAAGFAAVFALNAYYDPVTLVAHELTWGRAVASAIALALTILVCLLLKASHPPAGATTLIVSLGSFKIEDIPSVVIGVLIVAVAGELVRRMRLGEVTMRQERQEARLPAPKPKPQS